VSNMVNPLTLHIVLKNSALVCICSLTAEHMKAPLGLFYKILQICNALKMDR